LKKAAPIHPSTTSLFITNEALSRTLSKISYSSTGCVTNYKRK